MQLLRISLIALLSSYVAAQDIDDDDVPRECRTVCASVTQLTQQCDRQHDDDDRNYINCVCSATNAATDIPACEACVANYDRDDGHDNDVNDLVRSCSFTTATFTSIAGSVTSTGSASTTSPSSVVAITTSGVSTRTANAASSASSIASSLSVAASSLASSASAAANPTETPNAAAGNVAQIGAAAAIMVAFLGLV